MMKAPRVRYVLFILVAGLLLTSASAGAGPLQHPDFERICSRLHQPVASGVQKRTWFGEFMNGSGTIYLDVDKRRGPLIENPYYGTGYPITEADWTRVRVAGVEQPVLVQAFERRVLTYTPHNPDGWKVEAGNVGRHYWNWRVNLGDLSSHFNVHMSSGSSDDDGSDEKCEQYSENVSKNGTITQRNSVTVTSNSSGSSTVTCSQTNITIEQR